MGAVDYKMCRIKKFSVSAWRCRCCRLWQIVPRLCSCDAEGALSKLQANSRNLEVRPCGRMLQMTTTTTTDGRNTVT